MTILLCVLLLILIVLVFMDMRQRKEKYVKDKRAVNNYRVLLKWMEDFQKKIPLKEYFSRHDINRYGVYGVGELGGLFLNEMYDEDFKPEFIIERNSLGLTDYKVPIITVDEVHYLKNVDCIIITAPFLFNELRLNLTENGFEGKIVSLEDIIFDR